MNSPRRAAIVAPSRSPAVVETAGQEVSRSIEPSPPAAKKTRAKKAKSQFDALERGAPPDLDKQEFLRKFDHAADEAQKFASILREEQAKAKERPKEAGIAQVDHDITRAGRLFIRWLTE